MMTITQDDIDRDLEYMNRDICRRCNDTQEVRDPVLLRWVDCVCKKTKEMAVIKHELSDDEAW